MDRKLYDGRIAEIRTVGSDTEALARTIWMEARGEGKRTVTWDDDYRAMVLVGGVIMERVRKPGWWGKTLKEVAVNPSQFSCWRQEDPNVAAGMFVTFSDSSYCMAYGIAVGLITETIDYRVITSGATHYHAKEVHPLWADTLAHVATVGNHLAYA